MRALLLTRLDASVDTSTTKPMPTNINNCSLIQIGKADGAFQMGVQQLCLTSNPTIFPFQWSGSTIDFPQRKIVASFWHDRDYSNTKQYLLYTPNSNSLWSGIYCFHSHTTTEPKNGPVSFIKPQEKWASPPTKLASPQTCHFRESYFCTILGSIIGG